MEWPRLRLEQLLLDARSGTWGSAPDESKSVYPVLRSTNIQDGKLIVDNPALRTLPENTVEKYLLVKGDILVTTSSGSSRLLGKNAIIEELPMNNGKYVFSNFTWRLRPAASYVIPKFLYYYLNSPTARTELERIQSTTSGLRNLNTKLYLAQQVPLPPLSEQRRIVEILDQAERIRRLRADADSKAERILPALFIKMFGDPAANPRRLPTIELGEVISEGPQNGLYKPASSYGKGTKILRIDGFYSGEVSNLDSLKRLKASPEEITKYGLEESDIVVNRVNSEEYLGKSAIIPALSEPVVFESNMMRFTVDTSQVLPEFVVAHLQTSFTRAEILSKAKRAINQASINQQDVRSLTILLPLLADQERFAIASSKIRALLARSESERVKLEILFDVLTHRAFCGTMTASWREARKKELLQEMEQQATALKKKNYCGVRQ